MIAVFQFSSVQFSRSVVSDSVTPWIAARQASLSIANSQSSLKLTSIESVMPSSQLMVVVFLIFWETSVCAVAASVYIPTKSVWAFCFPLILTDICYLWSLWRKPFWHEWDDALLWFWSAFLWWLVVLSTFSCICWSFAFPLWKNSIQFLCPF